MSTRKHGHCTLGVGCDEYGVCYAAAHGDLRQCGWVDEDPDTNADRMEATESHVPMRDDFYTNGE